MNCKTIKRLFPNKKYCIAHEFGDYVSFWEGGFIWGVNDKTHAFVGTKKQLRIILNNLLYQFKLRGAKVCELSRFKV